MTYFIEGLILVPVMSEIFMPQIELIRCNFVVDPLPISLIVLEAKIAKTLAAKPPRFANSWG